MLAQRGDIDLILSDVLMPGQTGPELIAEIGPLFPHIAVVFVTGYAGEANASEFGDHRVLRKPVHASPGSNARSAKQWPATAPRPREQIAAE